MKNRYAIAMSLWLFLGLTAVTTLTFAQSTEILPGLVLPQMTTAQRTAMIDPSDGALVFDKTTQSYWYRQNGTWAELPKAGSTANYWKLEGMVGNEIKNTNTGGFWSKNPVGLNIFSDDTSNPPTVPVEEVGTRLMWIPGRSAFRVGSISNAAKWMADSVGMFSFAAGFNVSARGKFSTAMGSTTSAIGEYSTAMGGGTIATGLLSTATGHTTRATGFASVSMNMKTEASGEAAFAAGKETIASGDYATALGYQTKASSIYSTSMGYQTKASGPYSIAMGVSTEATGMNAVAMGEGTKASGQNSLAIGYKTYTQGYYSTAMGDNSKAYGTRSVAMGVNTKTLGDASLATGNGTISDGDFTTAMGSLVNTNGFKGAFMIGDSDPDNEGVTAGGAADQFVARFKNGYYLLTSGNAAPRTGVYIANGQTAWSAISDSTRKERFIKANGEAFLTKLSHLRLGSWNYKGRGAKPERFYGPMAQEIFAAFGKDAHGTIGTDTTVSTINMDGLLFIFSQALEKRTAELQHHTSILKADNQRLDAENQALKVSITQSEKRLLAENEQLRAIIQKLDNRLEILEAGRPASLTTESSKK